MERIVKRIVLVLLAIMAFNAYAMQPQQPRQMPEKDFFDAIIEGSFADVKQALEKGGASSASPLTQNAYQGAKTPLEIVLEGLQGGNVWRWCQKRSPQKWEKAALLISKGVDQAKLNRYLTSAIVASNFPEIRWFIQHHAVVDQEGNDFLAKYENIPLFKNKIAQTKKIIAEERALPIADFKLARSS